MNQQTNRIEQAMSERVKRPKPLNELRREILSRTGFKRGRVSSNLAQSRVESCRSADSLGCSRGRKPSRVTWRTAYIWAKTGAYRYGLIRMVHSDDYLGWLTL